MRIGWNSVERLGGRRAMMTGDAASRHLGHLGMGLVIEGNWLVQVDQFAEHNCIRGFLARLCCRANVKRDQPKRKEQ
jgi:hypothetical protein